jgi:hypothetical protein
MNFDVNSCLLPLNLLTVADLSSRLDDNFSRYGNSPITANFIRGEGTVDISTTPMALREQVWKNLPEDHEVSRILKQVPVTDPSAMLAHLDFWDKHRNLEWRKIFPEVAKFYK